MDTPLDMYEEVAQTLLGTITHCISSRNIERNLHLVYALVYHQTDLLRIFKEKKVYSVKQFGRIESVLVAASSIVQKEGARSAQKALKVLESQIDQLQKATDTKKKENADDFTFTYEEEADPEIFFIPYVWETIVCVVTSSTIEWREDEIKAFSLLEAVDGLHEDEVAPAVSTTTGVFDKEADDLV